MQRVLDRLNRVSIRWRLALTSALLTFVILLGFAWVIGALTARGIRSEFRNKVIASADVVTTKLELSRNVTGKLVVTPNLADLAAADRAVIKVYIRTGDDQYSPLDESAARTPELTKYSNGTARLGDYLVGPYRVYAKTASKVTEVGNIGILVQYGRPLDETQKSIDDVRRFLLFGVLAGAGLALAAGLMIARRAMAPIADLTATTREIARTRDPNRSVPVPDTNDEVAELARTLESMLQALESSRAESAAMLTRQRQFVADASHELRTPLTSVLANLEILEETLHGDHREIAHSALRSSRRMRRLVADLLLLARADAKKSVAKVPVDLESIAFDVAAELGPIAQGHELELETEAAVVQGARDELHRVALNLMENAIKHTPPGTTITAGVRIEDDHAVLTVADDGPGVTPEIRDRLFERFVRGAGDRGGSFGLGLSIVRAVAQSHGGSVALEDPEQGTGTVFVVRLPLAGVDPDADPAFALDPPDEAPTQEHEPATSRGGRLWSSARRSV